MPDLAAEPGFIVEDANPGVIPGMKRQGAGNYREKTHAEKNAAEQAKAARKSALKQKLTDKGIDKDTLQAIKELDPSDL